LRPLDDDRDQKTGPYQIQYDLQDLMQENVGIVRNEAEMQSAVGKLEELKKRAAVVGAIGNREYNPGWHTALDLSNLLTVSEAIARSAVIRKESRGAHFREDFPNKVETFAEVNTVVRKGPDGQMQVVQDRILNMRDDLKQIVKENQQ
jgi:succinate dehydrogenase / fumarate reductase flavoprotein subunit